MKHALKLALFGIFFLSNVAAAQEARLGVAPVAVYQHRSGDFGDAQDMIGAGLYAHWRAEGETLGSEILVSWTHGSDDSFDGGSLGTFDLDAEVAEVSAGVRKDWLDLGLGESIVPFTSAGVTVQRAEAEGPTDSDFDSSFGGYAQLGLEAQLSENWSLVVGARYTVGTDFDIEDVDLDADHASVFGGLVLQL